MRGGRNFCHRIPPDCEVKSIYLIVQRTVPTLYRALNITLYSALIVKCDWPIDSQSIFWYHAISWCLKCDVHPWVGIFMTEWPVKKNSFLNGQGYYFPFSFSRSLKQVWAADDDKLKSNNPCLNGWRRHCYRRRQRRCRRRCRRQIICLSIIGLLGVFRDQKLSNLRPSLGTKLFAIVIR